MKLLKYIEDAPYSIDLKVKKRFASRAIIFDEKGLIPMEYVSKLGYHKIPGGGIEKGEDKITACKREINEETGCEMEVMGTLGMITEYRSKFNLYQTSYCYIGKVIKKGLPHWEQGEVDDGHALIWLSLDNAIAKIKKDNSHDYESKFIKQRDLRFLEEAKVILKQSNLASNT